MKKLPSVILSLIFSAEAYSYEICDYSHVTDVKVLEDLVYYKQHEAPWRILGDLNSFSVQGSYSLLLASKATGQQLQSIYQDGYDCNSLDSSVHAKGISTYNASVFRGTITYNLGGSQQGSMVGTILPHGRHEYLLNGYCGAGYDKEKIGIQVAKSSNDISSMGVSFANKSLIDAGSFYYIWDTNLSERLILTNNTASELNYSVTMTLYCKLDD